MDMLIGFSLVLPVLPLALLPAHPQAAPVAFVARIPGMTGPAS